MEIDVIGWLIYLSTKNDQYLDRQQHFTSILVKLMKAGHCIR